MISRDELMHQLGIIAMGYRPDTANILELIGSHLEAHDEIDRLTDTTPREKETPMVDVPKIRDGDHPLYTADPELACDAVTTTDTTHICRCVRRARLCDRVSHMCMCGAIWVATSSSPHGCQCWSVQRSGTTVNAIVSVTPREKETPMSADIPEGRSPIWTETPRCDFDCSYCREDDYSYCREDD